MRFMLFWDVTPCSLSEIYRCFREISEKLVTGFTGSLPEDRDLGSRRNLTTELDKNLTAVTWGHIYGPQGSITEYPLIK
jgi:hypothetical protein